MTFKIRGKYFGLILVAFLCLALATMLWHRRSGVFRGRFTDGFETSRFVPCGSSEKWWVEGDKELIYRAFYPNFDRNCLPEDFRFKTGYMEVQGRVTWRGAYGHMGEYNREIHIAKVLRVQSKIPSTCE